MEIAPKKERKEAQLLSSSYCSISLHCLFQLQLPLLCPKAVTIPFPQVNLDWSTIFLQRASGCSRRWTPPSAERGQVQPEGRQRSHQSDAGRSPGRQFCFLTHSPVWHSCQEGIEWISTTASACRSS